MLSRPHLHADGNRSVQILAFTSTFVLLVVSWLIAERTISVGGGVADTERSLTLYDQVVGFVQSYLEYGLA